MEPPIYKIKTIEELVNVATPENFQCLMTDLQSFIMLAKRIDAEMDRTCFNWIDDGKSDVNLNLIFPEGEVWNEETRKKFVEELPSNASYDDNTNEIMVDSFGGLNCKMTIKLPDVN